MSTSAAALALRESFGDRRPPDITRKITACVACRKRKIKCHMNDGKPPCARCKTRGLPCSVNKSIQMILEEDATWKELIDRRIDQIEHQLSNKPVSQGNPGSSSSPPRPSRPTVPSEAAQTSPSVENINVSSPSQDDTSHTGIGVFPSYSLNETVPDDTPRAKSSSEYPQGVSTGTSIAYQTLLDDPAAEQHFLKYQSQFDHHLCFVLPPSSNLSEVASKSPFLAVAICTVAARLTKSPDYSKWKRALESFASARTFAKQHSFDDVRALCISAFWIDDLGYSLTALAVRISCEMNLHRCITKMPHKKIECYERTRLYFLVYIVDHMVSISHGRPPMTRELKSVKDARMLLRCSFSTQNHSRGDLLLISQVELWHIGGKIFDSFGADLERDNNSFLDEMSTYYSSYDEWWADWKPVLFPLSHLIPTSSQGLASDPHHALPHIYQACAKLYLVSHSFRGEQQTNPEVPMLAPPNTQVTDMRQNAVETALNIVETITAAAASASILNILTPYMAMMTAFACRVLLKLDRTTSEGNVEELGSAGIQAVQCLVDALREINLVHESLHSSDAGVSTPDTKLQSALMKLLSNNGTHTRTRNQAAKSANAEHMHTPSTAFDGLLSSDFSFTSPFDFDWMDINTIDLTIPNY